MLLKTSAAYDAPLPRHQGRREGYVDALVADEAFRAKFKPGSVLASPPSAPARARPLRNNVADVSPCVENYLYIYHVKLLISLPMAE